VLADFIGVFNVRFIGDEVSGPGCPCNSTQFAPRPCLTTHPLRVRVVKQCSGRAEECRGNRGRISSTPRGIKPEAAIEQREWPNHNQDSVAAECRTTDTGGEGRGRRWR
jgi:hypothetical protein